MGIHWISRVFYQNLAIVHPLLQILLGQGSERLTRSNLWCVNARKANRLARIKRYGVAIDDHFDRSATH